VRRPRAVVRRPSRDTTAAAGGAAVFSLALGLASVALPLLAIAAGYSGVEVGVLTAVSALSQMGVRLVLGLVMRLLPDWTLIAAAALLLAASNALVVVSTAVVPFVVAELLQGVARGCFWTGSQTHVVRGPGSAVGALATVNLVSGVGLLGGPVLAGVLSEHSPQLALGVGAGIAVVGCLPPLFLDRLPPFSPPEDRPPGYLWRRPGVNAGCWAGVTCGVWRGLLGSYVPVALTSAHQASTTIGILVAVANAASLAGAGIVGRIRREWIVWSYAVGAVAAGVGTGVVTVLAASPWAAAVVLAVSGLGAGALQTVGPAVATDAVHPEERGEAIAVTGTFRAGALFLGPLAVAGLLTVAPLALAMGAAGALITLPALGARRLDHHMRLLHSHDREVAS
jgi:MFS family permease